MASGPVHDPDLLDALDAMQPVALDDTVWRVTWATRVPLVGGTGGGRWHPPNAFEALYTSLDPNGAMAEIYHHLSRAPVFSSSAMLLNRLHVKTARTLVIEDMDALASMGVDGEAFRQGDYARTREIGAAAFFLDMDGLIVPSVRWECANLVLFPARQRSADDVELVDSRDINWPAWRETVAGRA